MKIEFAAAADGQKCEPQRREGMKKSRMVLVLWAFCAVSLSAQNRLAFTEYGFGIGTLNYSGEIANTTSTSALISEARPNGALFLKRNFNDWFALGVETSYGWIVADDLNHTHQNRGLSLTTTIFQAHPYLEVNFLRFGKFHYDRKFSIYLRTGAGFIAYNPTVTSSEVFPSALEPRPNAYSGVHYFAAGGLKFRISYTTILSLEAAFHNAGADDLDGILAREASERGANDTYGGIMIRLSKAIF